MADPSKDQDIYSGSKPSVKKSKIDRSASLDMFDTLPDDQKTPERKEVEKVTWCGSSLCTFTRLLPTNVNVPPVAWSPNHKVYVSLPLIENEIPKPYPNTYKDVWSSEYVRMPNSPESLYPIKTGDGKNEVVQRWLVIEEAFQESITSVESLRKAILSYNHRYEERWKFQGLKYLLEKEFCAEERNFFFNTILPKIIKLALDLPNIVTRPPILLMKKHTRSISLSQKQITCLLANAFLCTFPRRNAKGAQTEYASYPDINFNRLFLHKEQKALEKLKCIIHYFKEATSRDLTGMVTFSRQYVSYNDMPEFQSCPLTLSCLHIDSGGLIEEATGLLQMDFANKYIGGGVLGLGCVQEEIRFVLCPELLISRLFTEVLDKREALIITGPQQFSKGKGYASNFKWCAPHHDRTPRDPYNRRLCQVLALDALRFGNSPSHQYKPHLILRELQKAYVGFKLLDGSKGERIAVATGNWGCGAFKGNPKLKGLIQIAAASFVGRDVAYFTFGDKALRDELADVHHFLRDEGVTVGQLVMALCQYGTQQKVDGSNLIEYVYRSLSHYDSATNSEGDNGEREKCHVTKVSSFKSKVPKENKQTERTITDYFKPVSKSEDTNVPSSSCSCKKSSGKVSSFTEEKILEALNECDKLVKRKSVEKSDSGKETEQNIDGECKSLDKGREEQITSNDNQPIPSSSSNLQSSSYLFDCLSKIDKMLT